MPRYVVADMITGEIVGWGSCGCPVEEQSGDGRIAVECGEEHHRELLTAAQKREPSAHRLDVERKVLVAKQRDDGGGKV